MSAKPRPIRLPPRRGPFKLRPGNPPVSPRPAVVDGSIKSARPRRATPPRVPPAPSPAERSVLELIVEIKDGRTNPKVLSAPDRQSCTAHLAAEGLSVPEIAQFLRCSDRTITRDRRALQEAAAVHHSPELTNFMAGQLLSQANLSIDRIRRVSRDREVPPAVKVEGEYRCYQIYSDVLQRFQSIGFVETAVQRHQADVTHHDGEVPRYDQIQAELARLRTIASESLPPGSPPLAQVAGLEDETRRADLATRAAQVAAALPAVQAPDGSPSCP